MAPGPPGLRLTAGTPRVYAYVGPPEIAAAAAESGAAPGQPIVSSGDLAAWLTARDRAEHSEPFTYAVTEDGILRLAPRRSEHVACAAGRPVLAAGEIGFAVRSGRWVVDEVSNLSTGYCPEPSCWDVLSVVLDRIGVPHPAELTYAIVFRRCAACAERNVVRDGDFTCAVCDAALPAAWNFG
ncbi:hypothetical protein [Yinghuangia soli]|uniref:Uncharacterized protein n=1 Tax=Yinghuangia soli TaxID=2908204 RepID=A0AA41U2Z8_9ACTN|nr:hypothetical protein [Yinghuangia soli]MCF2527594.1 hypothetical protein [Yinghuangia soli]